MNHQTEYVQAVLNGEPIPVDTHFVIRDQAECEDNLQTLYPNEEDLDQWQNS